MNLNIEPPDYLLAGDAEPPPERVRFMELCEPERWALVQAGLSRLGILDEEGNVPLPSDGFQEDSR